MVNQLALCIFEVRVSHEQLDTAAPTWPLIQWDGAPTCTPPSLWGLRLLP
jgi:hypothetical protein